LTSSLIRSVADRIDHAALAMLPTALNPLWTRLARGQYAGENAAMYLKAAQWLRMNEVEGDVLEFGTGSGASFCMLYHFLQRIDPSRKRRFFLFDSFEGLPEPAGTDAHPQWQKGAWAFDRPFVAARANRFGVDSARVTMVPGFYEKSLISAAAKALPIERAALVHIDCDLFSSTEAALRFLTPFVRTGTLVLLDDYYCYSGDPAKGEAGAFHEWVRREGLTAAQWHPYGFQGNSYLITRAASAVNAPA